MPDPAIRARHLKSTLQVVDGWSGAERIRAVLPTPLVRTIGEAHGADWLPVELSVELVRHLEAALGPDEFAELCRQVFLAATSGPLLGSLCQAALRLFGDDPAAWVRWVPRGWALLFRDCGSWRVQCEPSGSEAVLALSRLPPVLADDARWIGSVASTLSALPALLRRSGTVRVETHQAALGAAHLVMRWGPPGGAPPPPRP